MSLFKLAKRSPRACCKPCWSNTPSNFLPKSLAPLAKRRARSNARHGCCICAVDQRVLVGPSSAIQDPVRLASLQESLTYLQNNESRMDYPRYRRLGLPIVPALVESLVKEINWRVKGTEKFWNDPAGAEAILQVRAALLSEDDRLTSYLANRAGKPYRRERARAA
jgi:hypothetical protein